MKRASVSSIADRVEPNVSEELGASGEILLDRFSPALITWAAHRLAANNGAVYREKFGVTLAEWRVLLHLTSDPGSSAAQLSQAIGYDKASISRTLESLRRRELIEERANPSDARSSHLFLTGSGESLYKQIVPSALEQERQLLSRLTAAEAEVLVDLLNRVVFSLREGTKTRAKRRILA